jgi:hypothetical protein
MQTKLTLRLEKALIKLAKKRAAHLGKSLSQMVADYFVLLNKNDDHGISKFPPLTKSLIGALGAGNLEPEEYYRYLETKHR